MGIRGLLGFLIDNLNVILIHPKRRGFVVARMYIDVIQFIHKALHAIQAEALMMEDRQTSTSAALLLDDDLVINKTIDKLFEIIREVSPRNFLGIYFDGIPPLAKVVEQRARRYEMSLSKTGFNKAKITVGTAFVRNLVTKLLTALSENQGLLPPEVEVSTPAEPGEGEHKLMTRIRSKDMNTGGAKVIVSDDGDVVIMSLLNNLKECYVYVDHPKPSERKGYISVDNVSEQISFKLGRGRGGGDTTIISDFCLMVILTGANDFMPRIQAARDRRNCLTELLDMYSHVLRPGVTLMNGTTGAINWASVRSIIVQLAANEERDLNRLADLTKKELDGKMPELYTKSRDPNTGQIKLMYFRKAWDDMIYGIPQDITLPESLVIPKPTAREIEADHSNSANLYLQGLEWTLNYMRTGSGPDWYFTAPYPPLFNDISKVMSEKRYEGFLIPGIPSWKPLPLSVYLLTILPKATTEDLFGQSFANAFGSSTYLADLFPLTFKHFSPAEWRPDMKGRAILPPLDLDRITKIAEEKLDKDIVERNLTDIEPRLKLKEGRMIPIRNPQQHKEKECYLGGSDNDTKYRVLDVIIPSLSSF